MAELIEAKVQPGITTAYLDKLAEDYIRSHNEYHADTARTIVVVEISAEAEKLIAVTKQSFFAGITFAKEGNYLNNIGRAIQKHSENHVLITNGEPEFLTLSPRDME